MSDPIVPRTGSATSDPYQGQGGGDAATSESGAIAGRPGMIARVSGKHMTLDLLDKAVQRGGPYLKGKRDSKTGRIDIYGSTSDQGNDLFSGIFGGHSSQQKRALAKQALRDALIHDYSKEVADHVMQHVETVLNARPERTVWEKLSGTGKTKFHIDSELLAEARNEANLKAQALLNAQDVPSESDETEEPENAEEMLRNDLVETYDNQFAYPIADRVIAHIKATFGDDRKPIHGQGAEPTAEADHASRAFQIYAEADRKARELAELLLGNRAAAAAFFGPEPAEKRRLVDRLVDAAWSGGLAAQLGEREDFLNARDTREAVERAVLEAFEASDSPVAEMNEQQQMALAQQAVAAHLSRLAEETPQRSDANLAVAGAFLQSHSVLGMVAAAQTSEAENDALLAGLNDSSKSTAIKKKEEAAGFKANLEDIKEAGGLDSAGATAIPRGVSVPPQRGATPQAIIEWAFAKHPGDLSKMSDQEKWDLAVDALEAYAAEPPVSAARD